MLAFKTLAVASDHAGFPLKALLLEYAASLGLTCQDLGTFSQQSVDYPSYADKVSRAVLNKEAEAGLLICGTGTGMSIAANRHPGIRAVIGNAGSTTVRLSRQHNHANILCLGERLIGAEVAKDTLLAFATTAADPDERHVRRIKMLDGDQRSEIRPEAE